MNPVYRAYFILTYVFNTGGSFGDVPRFWFFGYLYRTKRFGIDDDYPTETTIEGLFSSLSILV